MNRPHLTQEGEYLILELSTEVPIHERWLYKNRKAFNSVLKGIEQSKNGEATSMEIDFQV